MESDCVLCAKDSEYAYRVDQNEEDIKEVKESLEKCKDNAIVEHRRIVEEVTAKVNTVETKMNEKLNRMSNMVWGLVTASFLTLLTVILQYIFGRI